MKIHAKKNYVGFIAVLAVMVFSMDACKNDQYGEGDFDYIAMGNSLTITAYRGKGGHVTIPERIEGKTVRSIAYNAFANHTNITGVTIPSVTDIGEKAFNNCVNLEKVIIDNYSSIYISHEAFLGCTKLTSIKIQGKANIESNAFLGDFRDVFYATDDTDGTPGTYTTTAPVGTTSNWSKIP